MVNIKSLILYYDLNLDWNAMKLILTKISRSYLLRSSSKIKIQQWNYDLKTSKQKSCVRELSFSKNQNDPFHTPLKLNVLQWWSFPPLLQRC
jgi:hypothetical protein